MRGIDSVMRQILGEEQYLTATYAHLNRRAGRLSVVSAGHPPLIVVNRSGKAQTMQMDSDPVGLFNSVVLQLKTLRISQGDRFFLYSDGLIEFPPGNGRRLGLERLVDACVRHRATPLAEAPAASASDLLPNPGMVEDDLLLMA